MQNFNQILCRVKGFEIVQCRHFLFSTKREIILNLDFTISIAGNLHGIRFKVILPLLKQKNQLPMFKTDVISKEILVVA